MGKSEAGKGDDPRPMDVSREEYESNYEEWLKKVKENKNKEDNE